MLDQWMTSIPTIMDAYHMSVLCRNWDEQNRSLAALMGELILFILLFMLSAEVGILPSGTLNWYKKICNFGVHRHISKQLSDNFLISLSSNSSLFHVKLFTISQVSLCVHCDHFSRLVDEQMHLLQICPLERDNHHHCISWNSWLGLYC